MSVQVAPKPEADIRERDCGTVWWHCPDCGHIIAEITPRRVVVRYRRIVNWSAPIVPGMCLTCFHCHQESAYPAV